MIPSHKWFPLSLQERAAWYANFEAQVQALGSSLGLTAADITSLSNDNQNMQFFAEAAVTLAAYTDAVRQCRIVYTEGDIGDPTPSFPADLAFTFPVPGQATGMFERLDKLIKRIRAAPNYTAEIGALMGIIPSKPDPIAPQDLKPAIKAGQSFGGYKFDLNVTRLGQEAFKVQILRNGNGNWTDNGFATSNPIEVTVTPSTPGEPERIQVRAILMQKNEPVGQPSDPTYVTVNP